MYFLTYIQSSIQKNKIKPNQALFDKADSNQKSFFDQKPLIKNISVLWLKWTQTIKIKQNQTFFHKIFFKFDITFNCLQNKSYLVNWHLSNLLQKWPQTNSMIKIKHGLGKSDSIFPSLLSITVFQWLLEIISWQGLSQKWIITALEEKHSSFTFIL